MTAELLLLLWFFVLGSAVGSFLNVVVYRLPAGMSIVRPGSRCPACGHDIRWYDNVPVLGWIMLRGRCRDCRAAISPRYPLVEAAVGGLFVLLADRECLSGGANLPACVATPAVPLSSVCSAAQLYGICAYHLLLLCTLLAAALVEGDGHRPPVRLFLPAIVVGLLAAAVWPYLHPVAALPGLDVPAPLAGMMDGIAGMLAGAIGGCAIAFSRRACSPRPGEIAPAACVGLFLGWQASAALVVLVLAAMLVLRAAAGWLPGVRRLPPTGVLGLATVAWILFWSQLVGWSALL